MCLLKTLRLGLTGDQVEEPERTVLQAVTTLLSASRNVAKENTSSDIANPAENGDASSISKLFDCELTLMGHSQTIAKLMTV